MNLKLLGCIAMGVFVVHLGVIMLLSHLRPRVSTRVPEPNFKVRSQTVVDPDSGETTVYREITVTTRLAEPGPGPRGESSPAEPPSDAALSAAK